MVPESSKLEVLTKIILASRDLDQLFCRADFITLHVPLTDQTRNILNEENIRKLKPGVRIINCARGGLVDEEALARAIKEGHVAGAAFDVFSVEPATDSPLFNLPNVICTPHLGAATVEAQENVAIQIAEQISDAGLKLSQVKPIPVDKKGKPKKEVNPSIDDLVKELSVGIGDAISDIEIIDRMMLPMLMESSRCLEDNIVETPIEVDMGLIYGLGFPPFRGGIFRWADTIGLNEIIQRSEKYKALGKVYEPTEQIMKMAKDEKLFHRIE